MGGRSVLHVGCLVFHRPQGVTGAAVLGFIRQAHRLIGLFLGYGWR